jgi:antitoxin CcdA
MATSKLSVTLSIDPTLLREARGRAINLSATFEKALENALRQDRRERWLADNIPAIDAYNRQIDTHGAFADPLRSF